MLILDRIQVSLQLAHASLAEAWRRPRLWYFFAIYGIIAFFGLSYFDYFFSPGFVTPGFFAWVNSSQGLSANLLEFIVMFVILVSSACKPVAALYLAAALAWEYQNPQATVWSSIYHAICQPALLIFAILAAAYGFYDLQGMTNNEYLIRMGGSFGAVLMHRISSMSVAMVVYQLLALFALILVWDMRNPIKIVQYNLQKIWQHFGLLLIGGAALFSYKLLVGFALRLGHAKIVALVAAPAHLHVLAQSSLTVLVSYFLYLLFFMIPMTIWPIYLVKVYHRTN